MNTTTTPEGAGEFPPLPEALEIDWPELHPQALGCGVEDRGLRDRYECAEYGFQEGVDQAASRVPEQVYDAEQMHTFAEATVALRAQAAEGEPSAPEAAPAGDAFQKALELRIAQGWQLGGNACPVLYTDTINGEQVCRDDLWLATTAGLKGAPAPRSSPMSNKTVCGSQTGECEQQAPAPASEAVAGGAPFGIIDPDYARYYTLIRTTAWQCGYAIGLHGSFTRDLDLIATPWTHQALPSDLLIKQIEYRTDLKRQEEAPREKPHGRMCWSLLLPGFTDPRWIDFSVMPTIAAPTGSESGDAVDARRYRWLRSQWFTMGASYPGAVKFHLSEVRWSNLDESALDAAIDAALQGVKPQEGGKS